VHERDANIKADGQPIGVQSRTTAMLEESPQGKISLPDQFSELAAV
jgi:hypothetical protein